MKNIFAVGIVKKEHSKAAGEPERSSAGQIAVINQSLSSTVSAVASSFAMHSLTRA